MLKVVDDVNLEPHKRKRFNKNKKKAWRKKTKIEDVEEQLEEKRREERYGGPLEERKDDELLFLDTGDGEPKPKAVQPVSFILDYGGGQTEGFKPRKKKVIAKPLKSHQLLNGLMGAKTPHKAKTTEDKRNAILKQKVTKIAVRAKKKNLLDIEKRKLIHKAINEKKPKLNKIDRGLVMDINRDVWNEEDKIVKACKEKELDEDFVDVVVDIESKKSASKGRTFKVPGVRYTKTSALPAVQVPEAGQSYNPTFSDHQVVLEKAVRQQLKVRRIATKDRRAITKNFPTKDEAPTELSWLEEMSEGLPKVGDVVEEEEESEEEKDPEVQATVTGKRTTERKTRKQRKRETKEKFKAKKLELKKERRIRESNIFRVKSYNKEIRETDKLLKSRQQSRAAYHELRKAKPLRLGKVKYQPEEIAVSFGDELHGSLRLAKPAVSLLEERFKNLQRRNLVEPRQRTVSLKKRTKAVMRRDHKEALEKIEERAEKAMMEDGL